MVGVMISVSKSHCYVLSIIHYTTGTLGALEGLEDMSQIHQ